MNFCSKNRRDECVPEDLSPFLSPLSISFFLRKRESSVGREGAKTPSPFLERALHSSEGRDSYPFLSCSNGEETVSSSLPRKTYAPSFLFRGKKSCHLSKDSYIFIPSALGRDISFLAPYVLCIITERMRGWDEEREREIEREKEIFCPAEHTIIR